MADPGRIPGPELIPNCVQIRTAFVLPGSRVAYNVVHGLKASGATVNQAMANAIMSALLASFNTAAHLGSVIANNVTFAAVDCRDLTPPGNFPLVASNVVGSAGTGGAIMLPPNVALVLTLRTANAGPAFRGRMYIPGLASADDQAPGSASPGAVAALTSWGADVQAAIQAAGLTWVIAQPGRQAYTGHGGREHAARNPGTAAVLSWQVRNAIFDSQRRRSGRS